MLVVAGFAEVTTRRPCPALTPPAAPPCAGRQSSGHTVRRNAARCLLCSTERRRPSTRRSSWARREPTRDNSGALPGPPPHRVRRFRTNVQQDDGGWRRTSAWTLRERQPRLFVEGEDDRPAVVCARPRVCPTLGGPGLQLFSGLPAVQFSPGGRRHRRVPARARLSRHRYGRLGLLFSIGGRAVRDILYNSEVI